MDALTLGEKLLALLEDSARTTTYKPALLLALIDRAQEDVDQDRVPVRALAERVIELYWPQTLAYPTTGNVLKQSQTSTGRAAIVQAILAFRHEHAATARALPPVIRYDDDWERLLTRVEEVLAEWPIPRLQRPYEPFLYSFDWGWAEAGGWSVRAYRTGGRALHLHAGVAEALTALGPLLRPFITRWWTDKAAQLNPDVEAARGVVEFEDFLFGRDRVALERIAEGLLDLQRGVCLYCQTRIGRDREIDHFIPLDLQRRRRHRQLGRSLSSVQQQQARHSRRAATSGGDHATQRDLERRPRRAFSGAALAARSRSNSPHRPRRVSPLARRATSVDPLSRRDVVREP